MFKHILVATDGSRLSNKAVKQAIQFATSLRAKITAVCVVGEYPIREYEGYMMPGIPALKKRFVEAEAAVAKKILDTVKKAASKGGGDCDTVAPAGTCTGWAKLWGRPSASCTPTC